MHAASVGFHCPSCTKQGAQKTYKPGSSAKGTPFTFAILALIVASFLAQLISGSGDVDRSAFTDDFLLWGPGVRHLNEYWRLLTGAFLHGSVLHLAFNGYFIYTFGRFLESGIGSLRTALIYGGGLFGGSAAVMAFDWPQATLGASGAALGLGAGALAIMAMRGQDVTSSPLIRVVGMNLVIPLLIGGISFWGHFGGVAGGALVGAILVYVQQQLRQSESVSLALACSAVMSLAGLSLIFGLIGSV